MNVIKRFQFCLNADDVEIVKLGLVGFADEVARSTDYHHTLLGLCRDRSYAALSDITEHVVEISSCPLVELYINSSPRMEELFSAWSLLSGRRELEAALASHLMRCFVSILQFLTVDDARYLDITGRVLREHDTGLLRHLQSSDASTVAYTHVLLSLCLRSHKNLLEPLIHGALNSLKNIKPFKDETVPLEGGFAGVVLVAHLLNNLEYNQSLLVLSDEKLLTDLSGCISVHSLKLLLDLLESLLISGSLLMRNNLSSFIHSNFVNKLLKQRPRMQAEDFDRTVNRFLLVVASILSEGSPDFQISNKATTAALHVIIDSLVPQFDTTHQQIIFQILKHRPAYGSRCLAALKVSDWAPSAAIELQKGLIYASEVVTYLHAEKAPEWNRHLRSGVHWIHALLPPGLSKKELQKLTSSANVELQTLGIRFVASVLSVVRSHQQHVQAVGVAFPLTQEIFEEEVIDLKSLYQARSRITEAVLTQQKTQNGHLMDNDATQSAGATETEMEISMDLDLNFDGPGADDDNKSLAPPSSALVVANKETDNAVSATDRARAVINAALVQLVSVLHHFLMAFPAILLQPNRVDWSKLVDDLSSLSSVDAHNVNLATMSHILDFVASCVIRPATFHVWFGTEEEGAKTLVNLLVTDITGQQTLKPSLFATLVILALKSVAADNVAEESSVINAQHIVASFTQRVLSQASFFSTGKQSVGNATLAAVNDAELILCAELVSWSETIVHRTDGVTFLDLLLRVALRYRIDLAIAGHESIMQQRFLISAASQSTRDSLQTSPISPLLFAALSLGLGDLRCFRSVLPPYIQRYLDSFLEGDNVVASRGNETKKTKEETRAFFQRFVGGFRAHFEEKVLLPLMTSYLSKQHASSKDPHSVDIARLLLTWIEQEVAENALIDVREESVVYQLLLSHSRSQAVVAQPLPVSTSTMNGSGTYQQQISKAEKESAKRQKKLSKEKKNPNKAKTQQRLLQEQQDSLLQRVTGLVEETKTTHNVKLLNLLIEDLPLALTLLDGKEDQADERGVRQLITHTVKTHATFISLQYLLRTPAHNLLAGTQDSLGGYAPKTLQWIQQHWTQHRITQDLLKLSSGDAAESVKRGRGHGVDLVYLPALLHSLQRLQVAIDAATQPSAGKKEWEDEAAEDEDARRTEGLMSAFHLADSLCAIAVHLCTNHLSASTSDKSNESSNHISINHSTLLITTLNHPLLTKNLTQASAFGMICRRVASLLLNQLVQSENEDSEQTRHLATQLVVVQHAQEFWALQQSSPPSTETLPSKSGMLDQQNQPKDATFDSSYTDLLLSLLRVLPRSHALQHRYFLLRFQVQQGNLHSPSESTSTSDDHALSVIPSNGVQKQEESSIVVYQKVEDSVLWRGLCHLPYHTLCSLRSALLRHIQCAPTDQSSVNTQLVLFYDQDQKCLHLLSPRHLLQSSVPTVTPSVDPLNENVSTVALANSFRNLMQCYDRSFELRAQQLIAQLHALQELSQIAPSAKASTGGFVETVPQALQYAVDVAVQINNTHVAGTADSMSAQKIMHAANRAVVSVLQSLRHARIDNSIVTPSNTKPASNDLTLNISTTTTVPKVTATPSSTTVAAAAALNKQVQRWMKSSLKHRLDCPRTLQALAEALQACYHPGINARVSLRPTAVSNNNNNSTVASAPVFHAPANLLACTLRHTSFYAILDGPAAKDVQRETRSSTLKAQIGLLRFLLVLVDYIVHDDWSTLSTTEQREAVQSDCQRLQGALLEQYGASLTLSDRIMLRIWQSLQTQSLIQPWYQFLPILQTHQISRETQVQVPQQLQHGSQKGNRPGVSATQGSNSSNSSNASAVPFLRTGRLQRSLTEFPAQRSVLPQLFLWELLDESSSTPSKTSNTASSSIPVSSSSSTSATVMTYSTQRVLRTNEQLRWDVLVTSWTTPIMPELLQRNLSSTATSKSNGHRNQQHSKSDGVPNQGSNGHPSNGHGRFAQQVPPHILQRVQKEYDQSMNQHASWLKEQQQQLKQRRSASAGVIYQGDVDMTSWTGDTALTMTRHEEEIAAGTDNVEEDGVLEAFCEVYDPAFLVPACMQLVHRYVSVKQRKETTSSVDNRPDSFGDDDWVFQLNARDFVASGIVSLFIRTLATECGLLRTQALTGLDLIWRHFFCVQPTAQAMSTGNHGNGHSHKQSTEEEENDAPADEDGQRKRRRQSRYDENGEEENAEMDEEDDADKSKEPVFRERLLVHVSLQHIKDSLDNHATDTSQHAPPCQPPQLTHAIAMTWSRALLLLLTPRHALYSAIARQLLLTAPCEDVKIALPAYQLLLQLLNSAVASGSVGERDQSELSSSVGGTQLQQLQQGRLACLRLLRDGFVDARDHALCSQRQVYAHLLLQHYPPNLPQSLAPLSSLSSSSNSGSNQYHQAQHESQEAQACLEVLEKVLQVPSAAHSVLCRSDVLVSFVAGLCHQQQLHQPQQRQEDASVATNDQYAFAQLLQQQTARHQPILRLLQRATTSCYLLSTTSSGHDVVADGEDHEAVRALTLLWQHALTLTTQHLLVMQQRYHEHRVRLHQQQPQKAQPIHIGTLEDLYLTYLHSTQLLLLDMTTTLVHMRASTNQKQQHQQLPLSLQHLLVSSLAPLFRRHHEHVQMSHAAASKSSRRHDSANVDDEEGHLFTLCASLWNFAPQVASTYLAARGGSDLAASTVRAWVLQTTLRTAARQPQLHWQFSDNHDPVGNEKRSVDVIYYLLQQRSKLATKASEVHAAKESSLQHGSSRRIVWQHHQALRCGVLSRFSQSNGATGFTAASTALQLSPLSAADHALMSTQSEATLAPPPSATAAAVSRALQHQEVLQSLLWREMHHMVSIQPVTASRHLTRATETPASLFGAIQLLNSIARAFYQHNVKNPAVAQEDKVAQELLVSLLSLWNLTAGAMVPDNDVCRMWLCQMTSNAPGTPGLGQTQHFALFEAILLAAYQLTDRVKNQQTSMAERALALHQRVLTPLLNSSDHLLSVSQDAVARDAVLDVLLLFVSLSARRFTEEMNADKESEQLWQRQLDTTGKTLPQVSIGKSVSQKATRVPLRATKRTSEESASNQVSYKRHRTLFQPTARVSFQSPLHMEL